VALSGRPPRDMPVETFAIGPHPYVLIAPPDHRLAGAKGLTKASCGRGFPFS
jgi:LysR family transcriptional regulator, low CO2-responsive transcriptional regulator